MFIFNSWWTLLLYYLIMAAFCCAVQLVLCITVKTKFIRFHPLIILAVCWLFILLLAMGVFGTSGGGWIGNEHLLGASIFAIIFGAPTIGVAAGWGYYKYKLRQEQRKQ